MPNVAAVSRKFKLSKERIIERHREDEGYALVPQLEAYLNECCNNVTSTINAKISQYSGRIKSWRTTNVVYRHARSWIRDSPYELCPTDKNGDYVLVRRCDMEVMLREKLQSPYYERVHDYEVNTKMYQRMIRSANNLHSTRDKNKILESMMKKKAESMIGKVIVNMKTHKAAGEIGPRVIHSCPQYPFRGAGKIINKALDRAVKQLSHVTFNSQQTIKKMREVEWHTNDWLVRSDIENFFMEGDHSDIMRLIVPLLDAGELKGQQKEKEIEALTCILGELVQNQYVLEPRTNTLYRVAKGTGMGLNWSGTVSDLLYYEVYEKEWPLSRLVSAVSPHRTRLKAYVRYRDDRFFGYEGTEDEVRKFVSLENSKMFPKFRVKIEEMDQKEIRMLDFIVAKDKAGLRTEAFVKPSDAILLRSDSAHASSVHKSWPAGNMKRMADICSTRRGYQRARAQLLDRYERNNLDKGVVENASKACPMRVQPHDWKPFTGSVGDSPKIQKVPKTWIPIPFHPLYNQCGINHVLKVCYDKWFWTFCPPTKKAPEKQLVELGVCYSNARVNIVSEIRMWTIHRYLYC